MEMSGLDPRVCRILEVAVLVTDADLNEVGEGYETVVHQPERVLLAMDAWCTEHHGKSGLTAAVRASKVGTRQAETALLDLLAPLTKAGTSPLAGNSVHVDRAFIARYMPRLEAFLHYRIIDVSSVKELAKRWYPALPAYEKKQSHRALDDIRESIAELKHYRETIFSQP